ncbi:MAG: diadenylate cyclase CdaA [Paludibacteraceae bacterium]|nr:diadenylate cyclase CdaA [Paludibacteraceae bacterium]
MLGIPITFVDIIDILLFALILFEVYRILRHSGATNLFWGICAFVLAWVLLRYVFHLSLTGELFDRFISVGVIALIVIFQEEIRTFFYRLGSQFSNRIRPHAKGTDSSQKTAMEIVRSCQNMSKTKTGALIVLGTHHDLSAIIDTGEKIDARLSMRLLENIFFKNSPLHDGAVVVVNNRIVAAGCILPVSKDPSLPAQYGLRHRAALGITEVTGATAIVVSEETGHISISRSTSLPEGATIKEIEENNLLNVLLEDFEQ